MNEARLREEICRVGRSLFDRGLVTSTAGNISARLPADEGFLITPTDASLGFLDPGRLARVDAHGLQVDGDRASKALALHRRIYVSDPAARCVLHTHSTNLVALTLHGAWSEDDVLPPITPYYVMKVGHVPLIGYERPGSPEMADRVVLAINDAAARGSRIRAVLHERLGPLVWHETLALAMATLEELEEAARLWQMTTPRPEPLTAEQIQDLRVHFGADW